MMIVFNTFVLIGSARPLSGLDRSEPNVTGRCALFPAGLIAGVKYAEWPCNDN
jgi:hypothetical protein